MWTYTQRSGITRHDGNYVSTGYSGHNQGLNNPEMQNVEGVGPLPRGLYTIGPPEDHPKIGHYVLPLTPDPNNEMYGRKDFFIHGDNVELAGEFEASHGCIVQARTVRHLIWSSGDRQLQVV